MKNKVVSLTKVFLKNSFQSMGRNRNSQEKRKVGLMILYTIAFLYLAAVMGFMSFGLIQSLVVVGQEQIFLSLFFIALGALFLIQGVFSCINVFYFSKNIEAVLPLPLKPYEIILAKLNTILITEYITEGIFGLIPLILYGILTGASTLYYVMAVLALLLFPMLPLLVITLLIMFIMSFAKLTKHKDKFQMIMGVISIVLVIVFQVSFMGNSSEITEAELAEKLMQANGMVDLIGNYFLTLKPLIHAMSATNLVTALLEIIKVIAITLIGYFIVLAIGQKLYFKGVIGNSSDGGGVKKKKINVDKAYKVQSAAVSYVKKEFKMLFRNPVYFMQCVLPAILMPIIFLVIILAGGSGAETMEIDEMMTQGLDPLITMLVITGILQFLSMMIYIATTAVSRDGKNAIFMKYIPLSLHKQFIYKIVPNIILSMISMLIVFVLVAMVFPIPLWQYAVIFVIDLLFVIINSYLNLLVDLRKPKLEWDTEYAVVKQNMNLMWTMLYGLIDISVIIAFGVLYAMLQLPMLLIIGVLIGFLCFIVWLLDRYVRNHQNKLFAKIF